MIINVLESRLTKYFDQENLLSGMVHSKFNNAVNLSFKMPDGSDRLLTVVRQNMTGLPDSLVVSNKDMTQLLNIPVHAIVRGNGQSLQFITAKLELRASQNDIDKCRIILKRQPSEKYVLPNLIKFPPSFEQFKASHSYADGFSYFPEATRKQINDSLELIAKSWIVSDPEPIESVLTSYLGMGIGLTPSFDDALVGIMAIFQGAWLYSEHTKNKENPFQYEGASLEWLRHKLTWGRIIAGNTTDVSAKYLHCALDGFFSDHIIRLIQTLFSVQSKGLASIYGLFMQYGGSSGLDILHGASVAARQICNKLLHNADRLTE